MSGLTGHIFQILGVILYESEFWTRVQENPQQKRPFADPSTLSLELNQQTMAEKYKKKISLVTYTT